MCGIAGVVGRWSGLDAARFRDTAFRTMACRGPDGRGAVVARDHVFVKADAGPIDDDVDLIMLHTRLAILDLTDAGAQPMLAGASKFAITFNGEIYNYEALANRLGLGADQRRGHSDTEVLLHWFASAGAVDALTGMFALAYADLGRRQVTVLRDAFGIKPLFIARRGPALAFASDPRVLLGLPGVGRRIDTVRATEFLRYGGQSTASTRTVFAGIEAVEPGERIVVELDGGRVTRSHWYSGASRAHYYGRSFAQATRDVRDAFVESVRLHVKSDVRIGCALSGGIDSTAILCTMRMLLGTAGELHAVSHIADNAAKSEEHWIDIAAEAARATVHKVRPTPAEMVGDLDDLVASQGEPIGTTSLYAQYRVFQRAKQEGLTVMLDGQGADEMLAGYTLYRAVHVTDLLRSGRVVAAVRQLRSAHSQANASTRSLAMVAARYRMPTRLSDRLGALVGSPGLPDWLRVLDADAYYDAQEQRRVHFVASLNASLRESMRTGLVGLLRYEDRNSMRFSIESRVPFLESSLVELLQSMPSDYVFGPAGQSKYVFREAMRGIVPNAILDRRDKIGFENDEAAWLRAAAPWAERVLASAAERSAIIDATELRVGWARFVAGQSSLARRLWATLLFLRWHELMDADG